MQMEIPGRSAADGRRVALLVAAGLAEAGALPAAGDVPAVQIELVAETNVNDAELAQRILAETLRHLRRSP
jgi:hypothetical protein